MDRPVESVSCSHPFHSITAFHAGISRGSVRRGAGDPGGQRAAARQDRGPLPGLLRQGAQPAQERLPLRGRGEYSVSSWAVQFEILWYFDVPALLCCSMFSNFLTMCVAYFYIALDPRARGRRDYRGSEPLHPQAADLSQSRQ